MITLGLIGLVGGLIAGISPCILPVLPVIFMSGGTGGSSPVEAEGQASRDRTPYLVIAGLALSFSTLTLLGTLLLSALPLPADAIPWTGLALLALLGVGMIVLPVERVLERPFARLGRGGVGGRRGFVLGLALGTVYVPCAGPGGAGLHLGARHRCRRPARRRRSRCPATREAGCVRSRRLDDAAEMRGSPFDHR